MHKTTIFKGVTISGPVNEVDQTLVDLSGYDTETYYKRAGSDELIRIDEMSDSYVFNAMLHMYVTALKKLQAACDSDLERHREKFMELKEATNMFYSCVALTAAEQLVNDPSFTRLLDELETRGVW